MKVFLTLVLLLGFWSMGYSQAQPSKETEAEQYQNRIAQRAKTSHQIITTTLDLTGVSKNDQGALKDDFLNYKRQVISLDYNEFNEMMVINHSGLPSNKITFLLDKYNINSSAIVNE